MTNRPPWPRASAAEWADGAAYMTTPLFRKIGTSALMLGCALFGRSTPAQDVPIPVPGDAEPSAGVQPLTRGPVHEAFAEPVVFNPAPGPVVPKEPPAPINEVPPD